MTSAATLRLTACPNCSTTVVLPWDEAVLGRYGSSTQAAIDDYAAAKGYRIGDVLPAAPGQGLRTIRVASVIAGRDRRMVPVVSVMLISGDERRPQAARLAR